MAGSVHVVVLAGGAGERFWPASTPARPKPFARLFGQRSLLQEALHRAAGLTRHADIWLVGSEAHAELLAAEAEGFLPESNLLLEPARRDTAPAVALALARVAARDPEALLVVIPSDHRVPDGDAFTETVRRAERAAERGLLTCIGIAPRRPDTRFGYIVAAPDEVVPGVHGALRFVEKPPRDEAERLLATGRAYWNAGMLVCAAGALRVAFHTHAPDIAAAFGALASGADLHEPYLALPAISLDYAVLQKADNVAVVRAGFRWHDVGNWSELPLVESDAAGNFVRGAARLLDTRDSVVYNTAADPVVVHGMEGVLVARTADHVTLVAPLQADGRRLLRELQAQGGVPDPDPFQTVRAAAGASGAGVRTEEHPWGAEVVWSEGPDHTALAAHIRAGRHVRRECPDGWTETLWCVLGEGRVQRPDLPPEPLRPGCRLDVAAGCSVELHAAADAVLWGVRSRTPSAAPADGGPSGGRAVAPGEAQA